MADRKPGATGLNPKRGLKALMADTGAHEPLRQPSEAQVIPVDRLVPNPNQPRKSFDRSELEELADSIREKGVIQPLIVRPDPEDGDMYQIVAGERRWRAAQFARLHEVPVLVRSYSDAETLEIGIIENIHRAALNPIEEAAGYQQLIDEFGFTQDLAAAALGRSRSHVANMLRLLNLPASVREMVRKGDLSAGHARALVTAGDPEALARTVVRRGLSVRDTEKLARNAGSERSSGRHKRAMKDADTVGLEGDLSAALNMKVTITHRADGGSGQVTVAYSTLEDLDRLCSLLSSVRQE